MDRIVTGFAALALACLSPTAAAAQEQLHTAPVPGFVTGHEQDAGDQYIREEIPEGETVQDWSTMYTTQRFTGIEITPMQFAQLIARELAKSCPGAAVFGPEEVEGMPLEGTLIGGACEAAPGRGGFEMFTGLVVQGKDGLHMKQVAWRTMPTDAQIDAAVDWLYSARLCEADCPAD